MRLATRIRFLCLTLSILKCALGVSGHVPVLYASYEGATMLRPSRAETSFNLPIARGPTPTGDLAASNRVFKRDKIVSLPSNLTKSGAKTCSTYTSTSVVNQDTTQLVIKTACNACSTFTTTSQVKPGETTAFVIRTCDGGRASIARPTMSGQIASKSQISMSPASTGPPPSRKLIATSHHPRPLLASHEPPLLLLTLSQSQTSPLMEQAIHQALPTQPESLSRAWTHRSSPMSSHLRHRSHTATGRHNNAQWNSPATLA